MSPLPPDMTPSQVGERAEAIRERSRDYRDDADVFGVYCHDRAAVYLVPVEEVPRSAAMLRLSPPRNGQEQRVRWASQYLLSPGPDLEPSRTPAPGADPSGQLAILTDVDICAKVGPMPPIELVSEPTLACCPSLPEASLSFDEADAAATLFKALADPHRVLIVNRLLASQDPVCVCELNEDLDLSQPTVSFHLKKLLNAGILAREQRGTWAYYSVVPAAARQLSELFKTEGAKR